MLCHTPGQWSRRRQDRTQKEECSLIYRTVGDARFMTIGLFGRGGEMDSFFWFYIFRMFN